jgi:hypothetical protein
VTLHIMHVMMLSDCKPFNAASERSPAATIKLCNGVMHHNAAVIDANTPARHAFKILSGETGGDDDLL